MIKKKFFLNILINYLYYYIMWSNFTTNNYPFISKKDIISNYFIIDKMTYERNKIYSLPYVNYTINNIEISLNIINNLSNSQWVYKKGIINNLSKLNVQVEIKWNNNIIYLKTSKEKYNKIIKRLPYFLKVINYIIGTSTKKATIYLILTDLKKKCIKGKSIDSKHVNSGYCHLINNIIFIWRDEEFEKVTFHELMHLYNKDHRDEIFSDPNKLYFEALTDTKAIYYNLIYISIITKTKIKKLLNLEINFLNNQALYINYYLKFSKEISPVFSYYILKAKIFNYLVSNKMNEKIYNDIFINNINGNKLINLIYNDKLYKINYYDFDSARMTFCELQ